MTNYYNILGISRDANADEIKSAYRKLALIHHPDKNNNTSESEENFKEINKAYQVLSDPFQRARHDLFIDYQSYGFNVGNDYESYAEYEYRYDYGEYQNTQTSQTNESYATQENTSKSQRNNRIGNIWAFAFFSIILVLTIASNAINAYYERQQNETIIARQYDIMNKAKSAVAEGNYQNALVQIKKIHDVYASEMRLATFKQELMKKMMIAADEQYEKENYEEALKNYYLIQDHYQSLNLNFYYKLAACYKEMGNYNQAIHIFSHIADMGYNRLSNYVEIAEIYSQHLYNTDEALEYYEKSIDLITLQYIALYGDGYHTLVNPSATPDLHYRAFFGIAKIYQQERDYKDAEEAYDWSIYLRPDKVEAFIAKGKCEKQMGNSWKACENWQLAAEKGSQEALELMQKNCNNFYFAVR
jgi:curved DNA-binding protein CbpA